MDGFAAVFFCASACAAAAFLDAAPCDPMPVAAPPTVADMDPPMIVGGPQPADYVLAGHNQGMPLWVQSSVLAASIMPIGARDADAPRRVVDLRSEAVGNLQ